MKYLVMWWHLLATPGAQHPIIWLSDETVTIDDAITLALYDSSRTHRIVMTDRAWLDISTYTDQAYWLQARMDNGKVVWEEIVMR